MKIPTLVLLVICLAGCANPPGLSVYEPVSYTKPDGTTGKKMQRSVLLVADMQNIQTITAPGVSLVFSPGGTFDVSTPTAAQGEATKGIIKEASAGLTGAILSKAGAAALKAGAEAIPEF